MCFELDYKHIRETLILIRMNEDRKYVAIHQPQFMPWMGYFEKWDRADLFILLDDVQYKKNDFINRNRIRQKNNIIWLTVPVSFHNKQRINEIRIVQDELWRDKIIKSLYIIYRGRPYFNDYFPYIEGLLSKDWEYLSELNIEMLKLLASTLGIKTPLMLSSSIKVDTTKTERLIDLLTNVNATDYLCGQGAKNYLKDELFQRIGLHWQEYKHPLYSQGLTPFISHLSVVDLIFNYGNKSLDIIREGRAWREGNAKE